MSQLRPNDPSSGPVSREVLIVFLLTVLGGFIRLWGQNKLGLVHFDEGIYAIAGLWSVSSGGLAAMDPTAIAYAPPGFPILVGLSYTFLGVSDLAAILVSVLAGTLTIPATAWLARRTFGAGAGACAAALVALSGFHIAFSRTALTDACFMFFWVLGLICGQRFLEQPRLLTAVALGLSVGLAQLFKYNGWLIGSIVVLAAAVGMIFDPRDRTRSRLMAIWGLGPPAAILAAAVYWPWYRFVETHGGYGKLLAHQHSYTGGLASWLPHLRLQLEQAAALSGGAYWEAAAFLGASAWMYLAIQPWRRRHSASIVIFLGCAAIVLVIPHFYWVLGAIWLMRPIRWTPGQRVLGSAWLLLSILTPFYHPYARLWLQVQHLGWVVLPDFGRVKLATRDGEPDGPVALPDRFSPRRVWVSICFELAVTAACLWVAQPRLPGHIGSSALPGSLSPTDSLRRSVMQALTDLPPGTPGLRILARPPVTFYLGGRVPAQVEPDLHGIIKPGNPRLWALVDSALVRQEGDLRTTTDRLMSRWELVHEYPTQLNLPTLLDIDPGAARAGRSDAVNAPLWLLRPRTARAPR
jgi:hypothetical protein